MEKADVSRRNFLKGATIAGAGAALVALAGCSSEASGESSDGGSGENGIAGTAGGVTFDETYDVVVVGAGSSGEYAALEALEAGLSVVVLETLSSRQGSSAFTEAAMLICGTGLEGSTATPEYMYDWYVTIGEGRNNEELCRTVADYQTEVYERLLDLGVEFNTFPFPLLPEVAWRLQPTEGGSMILEALATAAENAGQVSVFNSRARHLIYDAEGRIVGVAAEEDGAMKYYGATCGVVLATGCYMHNQALLKTLGPQGMQYVDYATQAGAADNGDGLIMALEVDADTTLLNQGTFASGFVGDGTTGMVNATYMMPLTLVPGGGVLMNFEGQRFVSESADAYDIAQGILEQSNEGLSIVIYDEPLYQEFGFDVYANYGVEQSDEGYQFTGDTIEELLDTAKASYPGIDADACAAKIESYNADAASGVDPEYNREVVVPIDTAPYYAIVIRGTTNVSVGGLTVDGNSRVIRYESGDPIPGLYAAGMVAGGLMAKKSAPTASQVIRGLCMGLVAGRTMATDNNK